MIIRASIVILVALLLITLAQRAFEQHDRPDLIKGTNIPRMSVTR